MKTYLWPQDRSHKLLKKKKLIELKFRTILELETSWEKQNESHRLEYTHHTYNKVSVSRIYQILQTIKKKKRQTSQEKNRQKTFTKEIKMSYICVYMYV